LELHSQSTLLFMNDEFKRMWNEAIVAYFKELYEHLHVITEENYENTYSE